MKRIFTILAMLVCLNASAQGYYEFKTSTGTYTELTDPTIITTTFDQSGWTVDLATSFKMFGVDFASTNISIGDFGAVVGTNSAQDKMFAFDFFGVKKFTKRDNTSSISYTFVGDAGKRVLTIQYKNVGLKDGDPSDFVNVQVKLHEDGSQMEVIVGPHQIADVSKVFIFPDDKGPQVGIFLSNMDFTTKHEVFFLTGNPASPSASGMNTVSLNGVPAEGRVYTFYHTIVTNPPKLTLKSPIANEKWKAGEMHNILWEAFLVSKIKIEYSFKFGEYNLIAENVDAALGQYSWVVPNTVSKTCFVRITDMDDPNRKDETGLPFEIQAGASIGDDPIAAGKLYVYPNPNPGQFNLVFPENFSPVNATLADLSGRIICAAPVQKTGMEYRFDAAGIKSGLYFLNIINQTGTYTLKVTIR
jgi:hypothetical protein